MQTSPSDLDLHDDELGDSPIESLEKAADSSHLELGLESIDSRETALPLRPGDLTRLLLSDPDLTVDEAGKLADLCKIVAWTFHSDFYVRLRELKELYAPLDPDSDYFKLEGHSRERHDQSDEEFLAPFDSALERANYRKLDVTVIREAVSACNEVGLSYEPDFELFEHLAIYARGYTQITRTIRSAQTRFRKKQVILDAYQRLIVVLKFREGLDLGPLVRSDVVYMRMFKDVPHVDMEMHLPEQGTKVKMRWSDKAQIASPLVPGFATLSFKLFPFIWGVVGSAALFANPIVLGTILAAPVTAGMNSFFGFRRAKAKHLSNMIRNLYYLTLANNSSVITKMIDSAEEEEYKETMLAYYFLWKKVAQGQKWTTEQLDSEIESFLKEKTGQELNFDVNDALAKLFHYKLATRDPSGRPVPLPIEEALRILDERWDNTFVHDK